MSDSNRFSRQAQLSKISCLSPQNNLHPAYHNLPDQAPPTPHSIALIMAGSQSRSGNEDGGEQSATAGEKHQTEHESPNPKRTKTEKQTTLDDVVTSSGENGHNETKKEDEEATKSEEKIDAKGGDAVKPSEEPNVPSNILEKGIIYFFIRGRVNVEKPTEVNDIARSYMLLRPIDNDAKLGEGTISDAGNTRLLALPKKVLPESGKDRFMVFVEKSGVSYEELKKEFLASSDYETKTAGTRHTPAATPVGEGVYAITMTGRESHLAYMLTLPEKLEEVQKELGLKEKGSFIISTKNPQYPGPANARLPKGPDYPKE